MSVFNWLARQTGLDTRAAKYKYGEDPVLGYTSAQKHAHRWVNSTCGYCSVGCGMQLGVRDNKVVSVRGNPNHPVNAGKLYPKGLAEHYAIDAETRAKHPLLRKSETLTRVTWDEALDTLVQRFREIQQKYGPESLGVISTGQLVTEEFYTLGKLVQLAFGTRNYDGNTTLCMSTAVAGYKRSFGNDGPPGAYHDLEVADVILLIGANVAENHPILCTRLEANRAKALIVVDPRVTKTAMMADVYLPLKPRSDLALINAILRIIIDEGLYDQEYVDSNTTGFNALRESLEPYTLEYTANITGLSPELVHRTAMLYGKAKAAFIAQHYGWHFVFGLALLPVLLVLATFFLLAKDSPAKSSPKPWNKYAQLFTQADTWRLCFLYSLTFGGFVGLTSFLTSFFHDQYHLSKVQSGDFTSLVVVASSFLRPVGGWLSDRIGGYRLLLALYAGVAIGLFLTSTLPPISLVLPTLFVIMGMLGMGNGAVFQLAPQRFSADIELITGIVGAAGGLGGFFLPSLLGAIKDHFGGYGTGLFLFAILMLAAVLLLLEFGVRWQSTWVESALDRTHVFSYRRSNLSVPAAVVPDEGEAVAD